MINVHESSALYFLHFFASCDFCGALSLHFRNAKISFISDILFSLQAITLLYASIDSVVLISAHFHGSSNYSQSFCQKSAERKSPKK